jgi:hypothetical protein
VTIGELVPLRLTEGDRLSDCVDDNEVIAGAVHFRKLEFHGGSIEFAKLRAQNFVLS